MTQVPPLASASTTRKIPSIVSICRASSTPEVASLPKGNRCRQPESVAPAQQQNSPTSKRSSTRLSTISTSSQSRPRPAICTSSRFSTKSPFKVESGCSGLSTILSNWRSYDERNTFGLLLPTITLILKLAIFYAVTWLSVRSLTGNFSSFWLSNGLAVGYLLTASDRTEFWLMSVGMIIVQIPCIRELLPWARTVQGIILNILDCLMTFLIIARFGNGWAWRESWLYVNLHNCDESPKRKWGARLSLGNWKTATVIVIAAVWGAFVRGFVGGLVNIWILDARWEDYTIIAFRLFCADGLGHIILIPFLVSLKFDTAMAFPTFKQSPFKFTIAILCPITIMLCELYIPKPLVPNGGDQLPFLSYIIQLPVILCCGVIAGPVGFTFCTLCLGVTAYISFGVLNRSQDLDEYPKLAAANLFRLQGVLLAVVISSLILIVTQEQKERALQELERANNEKSAFMAFLCHELRNPLHAIMNIGSFLKEQNEKREKGMDGADEIKSDEGLDEDEAGMFDAVCESSRYMVDLINDVLDTSKFAAGKVQLEHQPCNLSHILESVVLPVREHLKVKGVDFKMDAEFECKEGEIELPKLVEMDGTRFKQVLINLLSNAVKFTPEGGSVGLSMKVDGAGGGSSVGHLFSQTMTASQPRAQRNIFKLFQFFRPHLSSSSLTSNPNAAPLDAIIVAESLESPQQPLCPPVAHAGSVNIRITLTDTGCGIPSEHLPSLFRPYHQAPTPYTKPSPITPKSKPGTPDVGKNGFKVGEMNGTGLGLSIVKQIVDLWGGEVSVESKVGVGSTFTVVLPVILSRDQEPVEEVLEAAEDSLKEMAVEGSLCMEAPAVARTDSADTVASPSSDGIEAVLHQPVPLSPSPVPDTDSAPPSLPTSAPTTPSEALSPPSSPSAPQIQPSVSPSISVPTSASAPKEKPPLSSDFADIRVLIVDDSAINRKILSKLVKVLGVKHIQETSNGLEALEAVSGTSLSLDSLSSTPPSADLTSVSSFDMIFMDIQMPVLDGAESTRLLRSWGCKIPIVAVTGNHISDKDGFLQHGFNALAPKPFLKADAERLLRRWCLNSDMGSS
ncbi:hypothetical protein HDV05_000681 [Chytridiales sp. JEL 0842]|nr:hypothetical protein HDV05_000681 [Chytridiales sp. JEL 0842]